MIVLDRETITARLTPQICIPLIRNAMMAFSNGQTLQPLRSVTRLEEGRFFGVMPGAFADRGAFGAKLVSVFEDPVASGRQRHRGLVVLFDGADGRPVCVADAEAITLIRTAAATAVATQALALPGARTLGIFGCGAQARAHIEALVHVLDLDRVLIWGRAYDRAQAFAAALASETGLPIQALESGEAVARASDVICTVTASAEPILFKAWLRPGVHVNAVGSSIPGPVEVDQDLVVASRYIVDSRPSALAQAAEYLNARAAGVIGEDHIQAEIGEVLTGARAGRQSDQEITLYKSLGHVVQDLAAAWFLFDQAKQDASGHWHRADQDPAFGQWI